MFSTGGTRWHERKGRIRSFWERTHPRTLMCTVCGRQGLASAGWSRLSAGARGTSSVSVCVQCSGSDPWLHRPRANRVRPVFSCISCFTVLPLLLCPCWLYSQWLGLSGSQEASDRPAQSHHVQFPPSLSPLLSHSSTSPLQHLFLFSPPPQPSFFLSSPALPFFPLVPLGCSPAWRGQSPLSFP